MKIVINRCFGGIGFSDKFANALGLEDGYDVLRKYARYDAPLIQKLEEFGVATAGDSFSRLAIVEIPEEATDWEINEYDGIEEIIAVVDGQLVHIY